MLLRSQNWAISTKFHQILNANESNDLLLTLQHIECTVGWLPVLLERILEDRTRVPCPIIDVISDENFEYIPASDMTYGGFNWKLNCRNLFNNH